MFTRWSHILTSSFTDTSLGMIKTIRYTHSLSEPGSLSVKLWFLWWTSPILVLELSWPRAVMFIGFVPVPVNEFIKETEDDRMRVNVWF